MGARRNEQSVRRLWVFVADYIDANGYAPSHAEMARACHMGRSTVGNYISLLVARGVLEQSDQLRARALRVLVRPPVDSE